MFPHESLHSYQLAKTVARWSLTVKWPRGLAHLKDQAQRAATSIPLNIAEGHQRNGKDRLYHYSVAHGSAAEVAAILDLIDLDRGEEMKVLLDRVGAMLRRMRHP
jgi:four helix bundle protein